MLFEGSCCWVGVVSFRFVSFRFVSFRFVSFRFVSFRFVSFRSVSFHFVSFRFVSCRSVPFRFVSFRFVSFHFVGVCTIAIAFGIRAVLCWNVCVFLFLFLSFLPFLSFPSFAFAAANMPTTAEATHLFEQAEVLFGPAKAANAGGVAVSGLEMAQNSARLAWSREEVDQKLHKIMSGIYKACKDGAVHLNMPGNIRAGANAAGFVKVADSMIAQGVL